MDKKRRLKKMDEVKKDINLEKMEEKVFEKKGDETLKVCDFTDTARGLTGLVKDTCISGFQLCLSFLETNLGIMRAQSEYWVAAQEEQAKRTGEMLSRFQADAVDFWARDSKNQIGNIISFQKNYYDGVFKASDKIMKESLQLMKKNVEQTFTAINQYLTY
ncbi:MAG TPA: hypothetical protein VNN20_02275 [Thermodesulfobacteriota bacterium]|nr:hypothetical protein [Thermodesulfobacteriota bacterium]